jgi:hypothetical protein
VRYEWLALVPLSRAVGIDIVDVWPVGFVLLVCEDDDIVNVEEAFTPGLQVWRVKDEAILRDTAVAAAAFSLTRRTIGGVKLFMRKRNAMRMLLMWRDR